MEKILVSACLLGYNVKYNGNNNYLSKIKELDLYATIIPVCPEVSSGLSIPRIPSEIVHQKKVINQEGEDVTSFFKKGADDTLSLALNNQVKYALLKEKSPSCGVKQIYDGSFSKKVISGEGFTTKVLRSHGIEVFSEQQIDQLIDFLKKTNDI